jgi:hypothetical protein
MAHHPQLPGLWEELQPLRFCPVRLHHRAPISNKFRRDGYHHGVNGISKLSLRGLELISLRQKSGVDVLGTVGVCHAPSVPPIAGLAHAINGQCPTGQPDSTSLDWLAATRVAGCALELGLRTLLRMGIHDLRAAALEQAMRATGDDGLVVPLLHARPGSSEAHVALGRLLGVAPVRLFPGSPLLSLVAGTPVDEDWRSSCLPAECSLWGHLELLRGLYGAAQTDNPYEELEALRSREHLDFDSPPVASS